MARAIALHPDVYNLLIVININNFTVSEIRDALMYESDFFNDENETRKHIYRVIFKLTRLKLLIKHANADAKKIRYTKSDEFITANFMTKPSTNISVVQQKKIKLTHGNKIKSGPHFHSDLFKEKTKYEAELAITLSEAEEFKHLMQRFPKENDLFKPFYLETRERSVQLLGKVNALTKVLNTVTA